MQKAALQIAAFFCVAIFFVQAELKTCQQIETAFRKVNVENDTESCTCRYASVYTGIDQISAECSAMKFSNIFESIQALNGTSLGWLTIRDSITVSVLPAKIFANVKPKRLSIDRCSLSVIRENSISAIGDVLEILSMKDNKLKKIDNQMFSDLTKLTSLDLSENQISAIDSDAFKNLGEMTELVLNQNKLSTIEDGTFQYMPKLKYLSLIDNRITTITKDTFKGLDELELLQLQENDIIDIDWSAFSRMKKLKTLNIGSNHISLVDIRGLNNLQKLLLNNNSIDTLKNVKLRDLPSLTMLSLDSNRITSVGDLDFFGLAKSTRMGSISLASNNITVVGPRAFVPVQNLQALSLQTNQIEDLSTDGTGFLSPLKKLATLQLSGNRLSVIRALELPRSLTHLAVDANEISRIEPRAFDGIKLKRIYLNKNKLQYLHQSAFASFPPDSIEALDLSSNTWKCQRKACKDPKEWLPRYLDQAGESDVSEGPLGCLVIPECGGRDTTEDDEMTNRSIWITVVASILAFMSVFIMIAIVYLYLKDAGQPINRSNRANSDLHKLIENDELDYNLPDSIVEHVPIKQHGVAKKSVRFEDN